MLPLLLGSLAAVLFYFAWPSSWSKRDAVLRQRAYRVLIWLHEVRKNFPALVKRLANPRTLPQPAGHVERKWTTFVLFGLALGLVALIGLYLSSWLGVDAWGVVAILALTVSAIASALAALWYIGAKSALVAVIFAIVVVWSGMLGYAREARSSKSRLELARAFVTGESLPRKGLFIARSGDDIFIAASGADAAASTSIGGAASKSSAAGSHTTGKGCVIFVLPVSRIKELLIGGKGPTCKDGNSGQPGRTMTVTNTELVTTTETTVTTKTIPGPTTTLAGATTTLAGATTTVPGPTTTSASTTTTVPGATTTLTRTVPAGATTLPAGWLSVPVATVEPPDRLRISSVRFRPKTLRGRGALVAVVTVSEMHGYRVRGARVIVRSVPRLNLRSEGAMATSAAGIARVRLQPNPDLPLRDGVRIAVYIQALKPGDRQVSNTFLVQLSVRAPR